MTAPDFTVVAVRYCADVPAVAAFYETLGLSRRISTPTDGFVTLVAGDGLVMLHSAGDAQTGVPAGLVELSLEVSDLDAAADRLTELGLEPVRWDESYGQHLGIRDPHGDGIWINEVQRDLYGYREHDAVAERPEPAGHPLHRRLRRRRRVLRPARLRAAAERERALHAARGPRAEPRRDRPAPARRDRRRADRTPADNPVAPPLLVESASRPTNR